MHKICRLRLLQQSQPRAEVYNPDGTFIGRIERGFDFLGYHFGPDGLSVAKKTVEIFVAHAIRLYEQELGETDASVWLLLTPCKAY